MRNAGTPAGVRMFRAANAEPALSIFEVIDALPRAISTTLTPLNGELP